jgi:hypothetical protein
MSGKFSSLPVTSAMSPVQPWCDSSESTEMPMSFTPRLSNSGLRPASAPSSVVQTGVKSAGWEKNSAQLSPFHSRKLMVPSVVSAVKSGNSSPKRIVVIVGLSKGSRIEYPTEYVGYCLNRQPAPPSAGRD